MLTNRIRELRIARGLGLRALAREVAIDAGQLKKVEDGKVGLGDARKLRLAQYFDVSVADLFFQPAVESQETVAAR